MSLHHISKEMLGETNQRLADSVFKILEDICQFGSNVNIFRGLADKIEPRLSAGETSEQIGLLYENAREIAQEFRKYPMDDELQAVTFSALELRYPKLMELVNPFADDAIRELKSIYPIYREFAGNDLPADSVSRRCGCQHH